MNRPSALGCSKVLSSDTEMFVNPLCVCFFKVLYISFIAWRERRPDLQVISMYAMLRSENVCLVALNNFWN